MKLIYIIVSSDDDDRVMEQLNKNGFSGTKMATTGGFLRSGETLTPGENWSKISKTASNSERSAWISKAQSLFF